MLGSPPLRLLEAARADAAGAAPTAAAPQPVRMLMLATNVNMAYRVLRCIAATGAEVRVLGNAGSRSLRLSRDCRQFILSDCIIHGARDEALACEINHIVAAFGISTVLAGDAPATRALIANRDLIEATCFPLPTLEQFDVLNDKWSFARLCDELGILHPETRLLSDTRALEQELANGSLRFPLITKPLGRNGASGVEIWDGSDSGAHLQTINYRPVLVQEFIPGEDIGASFYAAAGRIEALIAHKLWHKVYSVLDDALVRGALEKIARHFPLDGVYNFDMRRTEDGRIYYLECNPRFYFKMNLSMIAGINFVAAGLPPPLAAGSAAQRAPGAVRMPLGLAHSLLTSGRCTRRDWAMARHLYSDPLPPLMELLGMTV